MTARPLHRRTHHEEPRDTLALVAVLAVAPWIPTQVEAGRGIVVITQGEDIKEIGAVADEYVAEVREVTGTVPTVGFIHEGFGLFWLNVWTWDGRYCLYADDQYWEIEPAQAATLLGIPESQLSSPFFYRVPPGLLVLIAIAILIGIAKVFSLRREKQLEQLFQDERYQRALTLINDRTAATNEGTEIGDEKAAFERGFEEAVQYLNGEGVPVAQAQQNLVSMIEVIAQSSPQAMAQG
jgi:hypothetical protein